MPAIELGVSPAGAILSVAAAALRSGSTSANNARYMQLRSTPEYRAAEGARRGEPTRAQLTQSILNRPRVGTSPAPVPEVPGIFPEATLPQVPGLFLPAGGVRSGQIEASIPVLPYVDPFLLVAQNLPVPTQPQPGPRIDPLERERRGARAQRAQSERMRQAAERLLRRRGILVAARAASRVVGGVAAVIAQGSISSAGGDLTPEQVKDAEQRAREAELEQLQGVTVRRTRIPTTAAGSGVSVGPPAPGTGRGAGTSTGSQTGSAGAPTTGGIFSRLPWSQILLQSLLGSSRARVNVSPVINVAPAGTAPLTAVQQRALSSGAPPLILSPGSTTQCECPPKKKKGPRKKCLEWAQISWRSGRYKGKPAGRKCVRREQ